MYLFVNCFRCNYEGLISFIIYVKYCVRYVYVYLYISELEIGRNLVILGLLVSYRISEI